MEGPRLDVTFLLTTTGPLLRPRWPPGRAGSTWRQNPRCLTPPRAAGSSRLYQGDVVLDLAERERMIERTEGVTASFLKELIRKAALLACEERHRQRSRRWRPGRHPDRSGRAHPGHR